MAKSNDSSNSPTTEDNLINRVILYLGYCVHEFSVKGSKILLVSMDKSNSKASGYEKYLCKGIESSIGAGGVLVAGPIGYRVGKLAGKPLGFLTTGKCSLFSPFKRKLDLLHHNLLLITNSS